MNHHTKGRLPVDATSGCPEIDHDVALQLISEYEQHVRTKDMHEARVRCVLTDMSQASTEDLALSMWSGGVEAAAALRLLTLRLFPSVPPRVVQAGASQPHSNRHGRGVEPSRQETGGEIWRSSGSLQR